MVTLSRFHKRPLANACQYEPVMSKMAPDIHPPKAMPTIVDMMRMPTRVPDPCGGKYSRTIMAYMGTMPPWNRPNSAETT